MNGRTMTLPLIRTVLRRQPAVATAAPGVSVNVVPNVAMTVLFAVALSAAAPTQAAPAAAATAARPALVVNTVRPQKGEIADTLSANGSINAWQEASIGAEVNGLRIAEVRVDVGAAVKRGQVLAVFATETVRADLANVEAAMAEARPRRPRRRPMPIGRRRSSRAGRSAPSRSPST